ncbi:MAG TPA: FtsQ-type POTRA domain-containing protein [Actinomycetota bacterium]|nr:FtsQ-type POTRA domain-containing protein [Actinomycetota bacterium]
MVTSPIFDVREIRISGAARLDRARVLEVAGVREGMNLLGLDLRGVERSLAREPWVAAATVRRDLPSTVHLDLTERIAAGVITDPRGTVIVASDGVVLERADGVPAARPSLGRSDRILRPGSRAPTPRPLLRVVASLPEALRRHVARVRTGRDGVELDLARGGVVLYGPADQLQAKNAALRQILRYARREGIAIGYIDVRSPTGPALKPAGSPDPAEPVPTLEP